jgi:hypothetical protein
MSPLSILSNIPLGDGPTNGDTSTVGEPTAAAASQQIFVTGNWYASRSSDGGTNWTHVDPFTTLPSAAGGFCCDQVVLHDSSRGLWIWILQYSAIGGANVFRIAATHDSGFDTGQWFWWDIAPTTVDATWTNAWFDYPDAVLNGDNLYVTFNVFNLVDEFQRAVVMRFPLQSIHAGEALNLSHWSTPGNGSLRLTQGAGSTMYWASHNSLSQVRLFAWPDAQPNISWWDIDVTTSNDVISSAAPNGTDWLSRADTRITGACVSNGLITFMWTSGSGTSRPHPYCRVIQINENSKQLTAEPDLWSQDRAWSYPASCPNSDGVVGFTAFHGGADRHPGHVVGYLDGSTWTTGYSRQGSHSPNEALWGDYLSCQRHSASAKTWVASGYTLEGGETRNDILPRVVQFTKAP